MEEIDEAYDLTILWRHRPLDGDFIARRLACTEFILCASPEYLDRRGRPEHPRELSEHMLLLPPTMSGRPGAMSFTSRVATEGLERSDTWTVTPNAHAPMRTMNSDLSYAAALSGMGICSLPSFVIEDAVLEHALEMVLPDWRLHESTVWACMPSRKHVPARTRALLDFLIETFGGDALDPWLNQEVCAART